MASVSYQLKPGTDISYSEDDIVAGTAAPTTAGDIELRVDLANTPTRKQVVMVLEAFIRRIEGSRYGTADIKSV